MQCSSEYTGTVGPPNDIGQEVLRGDLRLSEVKYFIAEKLIVSEFSKTKTKNRLETENPL